MALMLVVGFVAGCGREAQTPTSEPRGEARGEPIRGQPIVANPTPSAPANTNTNAGAVTAVVETPKPSVASNASAEPASTPVASNAIAAVSAPTAPTTGTTGTTVTAAASASNLSGTSANPLVVGFDKLASFAYALPEGVVDTNTVAQAGATNQIPSTIRALNDRFVSLKGFMLPLKVEKGLVTELLIMRDQSMCCYGTVPKINEWVSVKMVGEGVKPIMDQAVTL
ncbi:MAG: hypothetical protein JNL97_02210, partial [Verrucomicrobiales bacterium]|nr:hypothetical protein [Verrucomicrobiales bacterium]